MSIYPTWFFLGHLPQQTVNVFHCSRHQSLVTLASSFQVFVLLLIAWFILYFLKVSSPYLWSAWADEADQPGRPIWQFRWRRDDRWGWYGAQQRGRFAPHTSAAVITSAGKGFAVDAKSSVGNPSSISFIFCVNFLLYLYPFLSSDWLSIIHILSQLK